MLRRPLLIAVVMSLAVCSAPVKLVAQGSNAVLDSARAALDKYKDPVVALQNGYLSTLACLDFPATLTESGVTYPAGAMGVHLLNPGLVGAPLDPAKPQVLIYEPRGDTLQLVGAEWFVPLAVSAQQPSLFGHPFDGPMDGHQPIMPASLRHWDLHVWLWRPNPKGVFTPTNAAVKCPAGGAYTVRMVSHQH